MNKNKILILLILFSFSPVRLLGTTGYKTYQTSGYDQRDRYEQIKRRQETEEKEAAAKRQKESDERRKNATLEQACQWNDLELVKSLVQKGPKENINKPDEYGYTPLHDSCYNGSLELIKFLIQNGAIESINKASSVGYTPLSQACAGNKLDTVKFLLENGAIIEKNAIFFAANKPEIKKYLEEFQQKSKK